MRMIRRFVQLVVTAVMLVVFVIAPEAESSEDIYDYETDHYLISGTGTDEAPYIIDLDDLEPDIDGIIRFSADNVDYIRTDSGSLIRISDLMRFDTEKEATEFRNSLVSEIAINQHTTKEMAQRDTHGNQLVASASMNGLCLISLYVSYTTSGNNHTGYIMEHHAYTTFTGYTLSVGWNETSAYSVVTSSGKDIYADATGEFITYLLVEGLVEISRQALHLHGYCWAIK